MPQQNEQNSKSEENVRLDKLRQIKDLGVDPYPASVKRTHTIKKLTDGFDELSAKKQSVTAVGRLEAKRSHGGSTFAQIHDETGQIQIYFKKDKIGEKNYYFFSEFFDIADFIQVSGLLFTTKKGEPTLMVNNYKLLAKAVLPLPEKWHGIKDVEERYRKRYLDLIANKEVKQRFKIRSQIITSIRKVLDGRGFLEVETPTLQPVYGGGYAKPFKTHHNALDSDFYLRISDEMYLKRLIIGGYEKVYEITKVFRNEGTDRDHNPEFTMFEAMIAYEDYRYGMDLIEDLIDKSILESLNTTEVKYQDNKLNFKRPWKKLKLIEAVKEVTNLDPLSWKTLEEAKEAVLKLSFEKEKLAEFKKMKSIGEIIFFVFEELVEEKLIQPTIIYDYPIEVSPLAKKCEDPRFTQRFEMFANGFELGNNYSELNDPVDLEKRFIDEKNKEKAGLKDAHQTDQDYLTAIKHGLPPTCGIAIGIDRLAMLFTDAQNIKEIIFFPTLKPRSK